MTSEEFTPEWIKELREKFGISQVLLAQALKVSPISVYNWENGRVKPSRMARENLRRISRKKYIGV